jgi:two-component system OmpR family response regulator
MPKMDKRSLKIVAVDDEKDFLYLLRTWLSPQHDLICLPDGRGLLDVVEDVEPDVVLLDVFMPEITGFDLCRTLRDRFPALPVILLTGSRNDSDFVKGLAAGTSVVAAV